MDESLRRSIILDLVSRLESQGRDVRMTSLQKLPYFLQEVLKVPLGLRFVMHYYGPYSSDLAHSIDAMAATGTLCISRDPTGYGYWVSASRREDAEEILADTEDGRAQYEVQLDVLVSTLGKLSLDDLELLSTSHFVRKLLRQRSQPDDDDRVAAEVVGLKPKFGRQRIGEAVSQLSEIVVQLETGDHR